MVFRWNLNDSKFPLVSRTLLSILADLNNAVVWMVSFRLLIFKSSNPFFNPLVTVRRAPITIGMNVTYYYYYYLIKFSLYSQLVDFIETNSMSFQNFRIPVC